MFRHDGLFGIPWFGKAYFFVSIALSLFITYRFKVFEEGTFSHTLLRLLLRSFGSVMLFLQCSPNTDVCIAFGIAAFLRDYILDIAHELSITIEGSRQIPTINYSGQLPLTDDQYTLQGKIHTAAHLEKLREHLKTPEGKTKLDKIQAR